MLLAGLAVLALLLWWMPFSATYGAWSGRVVAIHDGDTLTILRYGRGVKVRLHAIDAPELSQAYGQRARQSLADLCFGRYVRVESVGQDRYGRTLAGVECGGLEANAEQLRRGMAWHYTQYSNDAELRAVEAEARRRRVGLWSGNPEPP